MNRINGRGNRLNPLDVEHQPIEKRSGHATGAGLGDILGIGGQNGGRLARTAAAISSKARSFWAVEASARVRAATRAWRAISPSVAAISPVPSMLFSGALMLKGPSNPYSLWFLSRRGATGEVGRFRRPGSGIWG